MSLSTVVILPKAGSKYGVKVVSFVLASIPLFLMKMTTETVHIRRVNEPHDVRYCGRRN